MVVLGEQGERGGLAGHGMQAGGQVLAGARWYFKIGEEVPRRERSRALEMPLSTQ